MFLFSLPVDCTKAGNGHVEVMIKNMNMSVPCYVSEESPNVYAAKFTPYKPGTYKICVSYNKAEIRGNKGIYKSITY